HFATADGMTSMNVFVLAYLVITFGELCLSPIGLSLMTKLSPQKIQGLMMGMWFLASAYGQYAAGLLGAGISVDDSTPHLGNLIAYTDGYRECALYGVILGVVLIALSPMIRRLMRRVHCSLPFAHLSARNLSTPPALAASTVHVPALSRLG